MTKSIEKAISAKNLAFKYKDSEKYALKDFNLDVNQGEFVVIMGPSGAGKSTFANSLNGLIPNFIKGTCSGELSVFDKDPRKESVSTMAREVGLVFQDFESQLFCTNIRLEVAFGPENFLVPRQDMDRRIDKVLDVVDLVGFDERQPATLSGGQKQRLAIGSVLSSEPQLICMDEPTTDLDPYGKMGIFNIARALHDEGEMTLVVIEHETEEALRADRLVLMNEGKIVKEGKPREVLADVETMDELGLQSLHVPKFFKEMGDETLPITPEEGKEEFLKKFKINEEKYQKLLEKDKKIEDSYGETLIEVKDLSFTYPNGKKALNNINLEVKKGEFLAVLGHNGSGKTTLVKHFNGLLSPTEGNVIVKGIDTKKSSIFEIGKIVGYTFQNPDHQIFSDTVYDEVAFSPKIRGLSDEEIKKRVEESLAAVDMAGYEKEDPFTLTKGMRQRIAVASILSSRPDVLILDEPTTGLDYKGQKQMMELIKKLNEEGHTIIMITHTMWVVAEYAHRVCVIENGDVVMMGRTRDIFKEEEKLEKVYLKNPHIVSMSNKLGKTVLSIDEMKSITEAK